MSGRRCVTAILACGVFALCGCVIESPLSVQRFWVDRNSYNQFAIVHDRITHQPMRSHRVNELRWMYNAGPHETGAYSLLPASRGGRPPVPAQAVPPSPPSPHPPGNGALVPPAPSTNERRVPNPSDDPNAPVAGSAPRRLPPRTAGRGGWRFFQ